MGEIAEALKRASEERVHAPNAATPDGGEITQALKRDEAEREKRAPQPPVVSEPSPGPSNEVQPYLGATTEYGQEHLDQHRQLALRVRSELEAAGQKTLVVVSALRNEGKTTVAINLAMALASITQDRGVALVDLDLRSPSIAARMKIQALTGIEEVLQGTQTLERACRSLGQPELDLYPAHTPYRAAHELLMGSAYHDMLRRLEDRYATVVIDTPPTLLVPDSTLILQHGAACVAVANVGITRVRRFEEMLKLLPPQQVIGKILNGTASPRHQQDYYYYYGEDNEE